jgi:hypothetical protein
VFMLKIGFAQMTVLQIAALKKVKKGTRVLILDKNGGVAKAVARGLNGKGYKKVFVISGGFNSWTSSKLQTRGSSSVSPSPPHLSSLEGLSLGGGVQGLGLKP